MTTPETKPLPNEFNDDTDFWPHEVCKTYEANRNGIVRNKFTKTIANYKDNYGYLRFPCPCCKTEGKKYKNYKNHRFIWECFQGLIEDDKVIDHKNNIKSDNQLENLQLLTHSENRKKDYKHRSLKPVRIKAVNVRSGEVFVYKSITGASKDLNINRGSISYVLSGMTKTALSKKYGERYTFQKLDKNSENTSSVIIIKNKINLPIHQVRKMIVNNSS